MSAETQRFQKRVIFRAARKLQAQRSGPPSVSMGLGMFGVIGWSVAAPTLLGALLGDWIDRHHRDAHSWTLALLVAGLLLGCAGAWFWISAQTKRLGHESRNPQDRDHA